MKCNTIKPRNLMESSDNEEFKLPLKVQQEENDTETESEVSSLSNIYSTPIAQRRENEVEKRRQEAIEYQLMLKS